MENYKKCVNTGQLDQYLNEADHPAIIDHATFELANAMIKSHGERLGREKAVKDTKRYVFSGRLICGLCGGHMRRGKDALDRIAMYILLLLCIFGIIYLFSTF